MDMPSVDSIYEIETAKTLVIIPSDDENVGSVGIYEFLHKSFARCPINSLYWLAYFKQPKSLSKARFDHPNYDGEILRSEILALLEVGFLVSPMAGVDSRSTAFARYWEWDTSTALFHFTVTDNPFMSDAEAKQNQVRRLENDPPPPFWWSPKQQQKIDVSSYAESNSSQLLDIMRKRRTNRTSTGQSISLSEIAGCLYAGFGILGTIKATSGDVPLTMTPSGGARNPYEAFAIVRRSTEIEPGIYHYCAAEQVMEMVDDFDTSISIASYFGSQDWIDEMSVVIVLVAVFDRMMWKYQDPNAYRVMLIQAGHIGQNIMLKATEDGLTVCPTAAMSHNKVSELLKLKNEILHVPIYALTLDRARPTQQTISPIQRHQTVSQ